MTRSSLYLGKIAGIKLYVHWTFLLLIVWVVLSSYRNGFNEDSTLYSVLLVLTAFVCVTLHEFGHALTAKHFHYITNDITLLPIGGIARMDELPDKPKQELAVALAGPLVNVVIALVLLPFVLWKGLPDTNAVTIIGGNMDDYLGGIFYINISLAIFNLIPAFPMDGGRVFRALLSFFMNRVKATTVASRTGQSISILFIVVGLFGNPVLAIIGVVIFLLAKAENELVKSVSLLEGFTVSDVLMRKYHTLNEDDSINDAVKVLLDVQAFDFLVMRGDTVVGTLNREAITDAVADRKLETPVKEIMNRDFIVLNRAIPLDKLFNGFRRKAYGILPVVEENKVVGVVDMNNLLELVMVTKGRAEYHMKQNAA